MKNKIFTKILFVLTTVTFGCSNATIVEFENRSEKTLDSVKIFSSKLCPSLIFEKINIQDRRVGEILFCSENKFDGSYSIEIYQKGKMIASKGFGYYTNGSGLPETYTLTLGINGEISVMTQN